MLKYSDLSKGQRKCINAYVAHRPELASADTIVSKEIYRIFKELEALRATGGEKVGYPNWLLKNNQIQRGVHSFPGPRSNGLTDTEINSLEKSKLQKIINTSKEDTLGISDDEFLAELKANGIEV
jgi:hypothetical protein